MVSISFVHNVFATGIERLGFGSGLCFSEDFSYCYRVNNSLEKKRRLPAFIYTEFVKKKNSDIMSVT